MAIQLADKLYTSTQVSEILGVSLRTLYRYMEDNKIQSMRTASGRHRFTKDQILDFLNAGGFVEDTTQRPKFPSDNYDSVSMQNSRMNGTFGSDNQNRYQGETDSMQPPVRKVENPYIDDDRASWNQMKQREERVQADTRIRELDQNENRYYRGQQNLPDTDTNFVRPFNNAPSVDRVGNFDIRPVAKIEEVARQKPQDDSSFRPKPSASGPFNNVDKPDEAESFIDLSSLNVRYYKSDYTDLIDLAKKINQTSKDKGLEYAFTLYAGLSLHYLIDPFTILHFYANPEDMQIWKDELRLVPSNRKEDANIGVVVNTDIVFVATKELNTFRVVDDRVLLKDLSAFGEEKFVKEFRQRLTTI